MRYTFSSSTTMGDPTQGVIRFNNSIISSVTAIAIDDRTAEGTDISSFISAWDDFSTASTKGYVIIKSNLNDDPTAAIFALTSVTDNTGWKQLNVGYLTGTLPS